MRLVLGLVLVVAVVGLGLSFWIEGGYTSRSVLVQRVRLGQDFKLLGPPASMIVDDPSVFVPGVGDQGARLVTDASVAAARVPPVPLGAVQAAIQTARLGCVGAIVLSLLGLFWINRGDRGPLRLVARDE